jgi:hypothetical protein
MIIIGNYDIKIKIVYIIVQVDKTTSIKIELVEAPFFFICFHEIVFFNLQFIRKL